MRHKAHNAGFTLFELLVVIALIAVVMAVALPQLAPALAVGKLEGAARRMAGYGRAAMAHSAFSKEPLILRIDMDRGQYWTVRRVVKERELFLPDEDEEAAESIPLTKENLLQIINEGSADEQTEQIQRVEDAFNQYFRYALEARARNVKHDGLLGDINPLEGVEFSLDDESGEQEEEIKTSLLERTYLPSGTFIERVTIGAEAFSDGVVDIEITPMGLYETVEIEVGAPDGGLYRVTLDPITGGTHLAKEA